MKKKLLSILVVLVCFTTTHTNAQNQIFYEGFEEYDDFIMENIGDWITIDRDKLSTTAFFGVTFNKNSQNSGNIPRAYLVVNPSNWTVNAVTNPESYYKPYAGNKALVGFSPDWVGESSDDWLISPRIELEEEGNVLTFWLRSEGSENSVNLRIWATKELIKSEKDFDLQKFELVNNGNIVLSQYLATGSDEWRKIAVSLDDYANENIQFAIQNISSLSGRFCLIDEIEVLSGACLADAKNIKIDKIEDTWTKISWEGDAYSYDIEYGRTGFKRGEGTTVKINPGIMTYTIEGLEEYTNYDFYIDAYCEEGVLSESRGKRNTFKTIIYVQPVDITPEQGYQFGFETDDLTPEGWEITTLNPKGGAWRLIPPGPEGGISDLAYENRGFARFTHANDLEKSDSWVISRGVNLKKGQEVVIYFYYCTGSSDPEAVSVKIANENTPAALKAGKKVLDLSQLVTKLIYKKQIIYYTAPADGTYYIGFHSETTNRWGDIRIDDINVVDASVYTENEDYSVIFDENFDEYQNQATEFGNWDLKNLENVKKITIEGVEFDNNGENVGFMIFDNEEVSGINAEKYNFAALSGKNSVISFAGEGANSNDWLNSRPIELGKINNLVSFWAKSPVADANNETFQLFVSVFEDGKPVETEATPLSDVINLKEYIQEGYEANWVKFSFSLDDYANKDVVISINYTGSAQKGATALMIDNFSVIKGGSLENTISNVRVNTIKDTYAYVTWMAEKAYSYEIQYGEKGFQLEKGTSVQTMEKGITLIDLLPNTIHEFYIRMYVEEDVPSETWIGPYQLRTEAEAVHPEDGYHYGFENGDYIAEGWRATDNAGNTDWRIVTNDEENAAEGSAYLLYSAKPSVIYYKDYAFTLPIEIEENEKVYISFKYKTSTPEVKGQLVIGYDDNSSFGINQPITTIPNVSNTEYEVYELEQAFYPDVYYFGFNFEAEVENAPINLFIDDIFIKVIRTVGIEDSENAATVFNVYPNPVEEIMNVALPAIFNENNTKVTITDMTGKRVKTTNYSSRLSLSELPSGIYTITVTDGINKENKLFIKK